MKSLRHSLPALLLMLVCALLFAAPSLHSQKAEVHIHLFFLKGHLNPHLELVHALYESNKFHITVSARPAPNTTDDVFLVLQKQFGNQKVCYHKDHSNQRSEAFDCPITFLPLEPIPQLIVDINTKGVEQEVSQGTLISALNSPKSMEQLVDYYFSPGSTIPRPEVFINELYTGVEPFGMILKQKLGSAVHIFSTFTSTSVMLPNRALSPRYLHPMVHQTAENALGIKLSTQTSNPVVIFANALTGYLGSALMNFGFIAKNYGLLKWSSDRSELFSFFTLEKYTSLGDVIFFSKDGVQEPPLLNKKSNFHYLGSSLRSNAPQSQSERVTNWMETMAAQGKQVIFISTGSVFKMGEEEEESVSRALIQLLNESNNYAVIWRVSKSREQKWNQLFASAVHTAPESSAARYMLTSEYLPQRYLLNHNSTSLFVTHCGFNGVTEAMYFGKPVLGFPFMFEQYYLCQHLEDIQVGTFMDRKRTNVTVESVYNAFKLLLQSEKRELFAKNAMRMRDVLHKETGGPAAFVDIVEKRMAEGAISFEEAQLNYLVSWLELSSALAMLAVAVLVWKTVVKVASRCCCSRNKHKSNMSKEKIA